MPADRDELLADAQARLAAARLLLRTADGNRQQMPNPCDVERILEQLALLATEIGLQNLSPVWQAEIAEAEQHAYDDVRALARHGPEHLAGLNPGHHHPH